jgi:tetratricopeptide (TPR) repeat protein
VCGSPQVWAERPGFYPGDMPMGRSGRGGGGGEAPAQSHGGHHAPCRPHGFAAWNTFGNVGWPWLGGATWINPLFVPAWNVGAFWPTGIYFNPATNTAEYYLPPTYAPAELSYGPLAVERFLGVRRDLWPAVPPGAVAVEAALDAHAVADRLRRSNETSRARGRRFVEAGDALFLQQRFHEALQRYKSAIVAAPDLADAYTRQGCALIAVRQYRLATKAFRIALELDSASLVSRLRLDDLYGDNRLAKLSHLDELARAALAAPDDGDLLFLVGALLHANGEMDRAVRFFEKAAELGGAPAARLLAPLLPADAKAAAAPDAEWDT